MWVIIPVLYNFNAFGMDQNLGRHPMDGPNGTSLFPLGFAMNTPSLFDKNGFQISARKFVFVENNNVVLNQTFYDSHAPIYLTTYFAVEYAASFVVFAAAIVHVYLWYGRDIWYRMRSNVKDLDQNDIHAQLMVKYILESRNIS